VRDVAREILTSRGYTVLEARDVDDALRIARADGPRIDLLLTDVVMPTMSGRTLAGHVQRAHPETRVLYMSGYTEDATARHRLVDPDIAFLPKPFTPPELVRAVRAILDAPTR
jgi:DNA-binding NtrC family response regulator